VRVLPYKGTGWCMRRHISSLTIRSFARMRSRRVFRLIWNLPARVLPQMRQQGHAVRREVWGFIRANGGWGAPASGSHRSPAAIRSGACAVGSVRLSASTRPVRCSIQGIALSGSTEGVWSLMRILEQFTAWPFVIYRALLGVVLLVGVATGQLI
jgi:hypothetical protein